MKPSFSEAVLDEVRRVVHLIHSPVLIAREEHEETVQRTKILTSLFHVPTKSPDEKGYPKITYEHTDGCIRSPQPQTVILSTEAVKILDDCAQQQLDKRTLALDSEPDVDERSTLQLEICRLQTCLSSTPTCKGLYIKRCNGEYRNALDDYVKLDPTSPSGIRPSEFGYAVLDIDGINDPKKWTMDKRGFPLPIPVSFTYRDLKNLEESLREGRRTDRDLIADCWERIRCAKRAVAET